MTPEQFVYWLQGYFELSGETVALNEVQTQIVKDHLELVFRKETPDRNQTTHSNFPTRPTKRGGPYPNPLGPSWDEEFGHTLKLDGGDKVPSPLGDIPNWEGSC